MKVGVIIPWLVILLVAVGLPVLGALEPAAKAKQSTTKPVEAGGETKKLVSMQMEMTGKYALGWAGLVGGQGRQFQEQVDGQVEDDVGRVAAAVMAAELLGKDEGVRRLSELGGDDAAALRARIGEGVALEAGVVERYGFFGRVAASYGLPETDAGRAAVLASAKRTAVGLVGMLMVVGVAVLAGVVLLIVAIVMLATGGIRLEMAQPSGRHALYVQGFALYLATFVFGGIVLSLLPGELPFVANVIPLFLAVGLGVSYPLLRGAEFGEMRQDWGLTWGKNPLVEVLCGFGGYLAGLPLLVVGMVITLLLSKWSGTVVSHPITEEFERNKLAIFLLAVVFAPITEEILFRGGFLSHCRSFAGPVVSGLIVGVIFAAIHPQGWAGIPMLTSIGFVMAMIRAWRVSIVGSVVAHAINNGFVTCLLLLMV